MRVIHHIYLEKSIDGLWIIGKKQFDDKQMYIFGESSLDDVGWLTHF